MIEAYREINNIKVDMIIPDNKFKGTEAENKERSHNMSTRRTKTEEEREQE